MIFVIFSFFQTTFKLLQVIIHFFISSRNFGQLRFFAIYGGTLLQSSTTRILSGITSIQVFLYFAEIILVITDFCIFLSLNNSLNSSRSLLGTVLVELFLPLRSAPHHQNPIGTFPSRCGPRNSREYANCGRL